MLPGYDYTLTVRVHDSYNSGNGQSYTNDVLWSYKPGAYWSSAYDDVMYGDIKVYNGGVVKFLVSLYFLGETGTYLLDIQIVRGPLGVDDNVTQEKLEVYPIPVVDILNMKMDDNIEIREIQIMDISGKTVMKFDDTKNKTNNISLEVDNLDAGTYIVLVKSDRAVYHRKFIKVE